MYTHQRVDVLTEYKEREKTSKGQINLVVIGNTHTHHWSILIVMKLKPYIPYSGYMYISRV